MAHRTKSAPRAGRSDSAEPMSTPVFLHLPELKVQKVQTTVTVPDGGTVMLGGLKESEQAAALPTAPHGGAALAELSDEEKARREARRKK